MPLFSNLKNKFKKPANDDEAVKVCPKCQKNPCACNNKASNGGNQVRMSPTGLPLPPCDRPLVSYYGSPYALAPDTICQFPEDIGEPIPIAQMEAHIKHLMNPVCQFGPVTFDGFDVEFKYLETLEAKRPPLDFTSAQLEPNILKNRYGNILPPEHTRVPLTLLNDDPNSHYINANYVSNKRYIASQGPLPTTFVDFWRLIWEQKIGVILMLTREIESGVTKCARYWPEKQGNLSPLAHAGGIQVRAITDDDLEDENSSEENDENSSSSSSNSASKGEKNGDAHAIPNNNIANYQQNTDKARQSAAPLSGNKQLTDEEFVTFDGANVSPEERESDLIDESIETRYGDIVVRFCGYRNGDEFVVRLMEMFRNGEKRRITQLQYTGWPDHGVPASAQGFVTLSRLADVANEQNSKFSGTDENDFVPPLLVHCSAGVGRTGTFMVVHSLLEQVRGTDAKHQNDIEPISVVDTLYQMRGQRPNSVQTKEQFRFCYQSLYSQIEHHLDDAGVAIEKVAKDENKATNSSNNKNNDDNDDESTNSQSETSSSASSTSSSNVSKNTNENSNNKPPEPDDDAPPATNKGRPHEPRRKSSSSRHRSHRSRGKAAIFVDIDNNNEDSSSVDQTPASPRTQEVRDRERRLRRAARDRRTHRSRHRSRYRDGERESSRYERSSKSTRSPGSRGTRHRRGSEERRHSRHRSSRR